MHERVFIHGLAALALAAAAAPTAHARSHLKTDLTELSLEELLATEVTSVAKRPQRVEDAAAAVFVISAEDIRRSGATSLPEILSMAPGMDVAALSGNGAAVGARGFNGRFSNKLLVLVDGRAVYLSTLSGVLWDQQLVPVEDIQRVEIVRGPGATLWGANAVDGVINVVTRHAVDAMGALVDLRADDADGRRAYARLGVTVGETGALRLYATSNQDENLAIDGIRPVKDVTRSTQAGFRLDLEPTATDAFTLQGDVQDGRFDASRDDPGRRLLAAPSPFPTRGDFHGANLLGRWSRRADDGAGMSVQAYYDRVERTAFGLTLERDQVDLDLSGNFRAGERHEIVVGAGWRRTEDEVTSTNILRLTPQARADDWYGLYAQDDLTLIPGRLVLTLGAKAEHNAYTGVELQPSARAIWTDPAGWSVWGAVSRAVRTPSRLETGAQLTSPSMVIAPNPDLAAEDLIAWELGWRGRFGKRVSVDLAAYHNVYDQLISWKMTPAAGPGLPLYIRQFANLGEATATGLEVALDARPTDWWTLKAAGSIHRLDLNSGSQLPGVFVGVLSEGSSPDGQLSLRSWFDLRDDLELDVWVRRVGGLETGDVAPYTDLDLRLGWRATPTLELFARGENLLDPQRFEMTESGIPSPVAVVDRRFEVGASVRF